MARPPDIRIRLLRPDSDIGATAALISSVVEHPLSADQFREIIEGPAPEKLLTVATDSFDEVKAYCAIVRPEDSEVGRFTLWMAVHRDCRRQGIGTELFSASLRLSAELQLDELRADIADSRDDAVAFATRMGFTVARRRIRSSVDPRSVQDASHLRVQLQAEGIEFRTLEELGDNEENRRKVFELNRTAAKDIPGRGPFYSYDQYVSRRFKGNGFHSDGVIVALDETRWIGFTQITGSGASMFLQMTGVDQEYRGRKIGQVLRGLAIEFANVRGASEVRTVIDSENKAMLTLNRRMDFIEEGETLSMTYKTRA